MAENTFRLTVNGETRNVSLKIIQKTIMDGWWSSDPEGKRKLTKAKLEETVYFHLEHQGFVKGDKIQLRLYDYDYWLHDYLDFDDEEFAGEEIIKEIEVTKSGEKLQETVELKLKSEWETMLPKDGSAHTIELYWEACFKAPTAHGFKVRTMNIPKSKDKYLHTSYSDRTLYFKLPNNGYNLPELKDQDGTPLIFVQTAFEEVLDIPKGKVKGKIKGAIKQEFEGFLDKKITAIALARLEKGSLVANNGEVFTNLNTRIYNKRIFMPDGKTLQTIKKRKNFGFLSDGKLITTRGLDQVKYFSKNGLKVSLLRIVKNSWNGYEKAKTALNLFDFVKLDTPNEGEPFSVDTTILKRFFPKAAGNIALIVDIAGILVKQMKAEDDYLLEQSIQEEIDKAKLEGLEATRKAIGAWSRGADYVWEMISMSEKTVNKLLKSEFKTFLEMTRFEDNLEFSNNSDFELLYRKKYNKNREEDLYIIETIFMKK